MTREAEFFQALKVIQKTINDKLIVTGYNSKEAVTSIYITRDTANSVYWSNDDEGFKTNNTQLQIRDISDVIKLEREKIQKEYDEMVKKAATVTREREALQRHLESLDTQLINMGYSK